ncbi:hypothetical protein [Actinomadura sp. NAK00032]|uniref:hypothetical protein n=1 Tax=Actinomadura sp. NAK00032 TaxID=2742128 RepID=UPI001C37D2B1|nr:hypothetical protein [Actinomadura sp. NAK00032]
MERPPARGDGEPDGSGGGEYVIDFAQPEPVPPPVTAIAWRLGRLIVGEPGVRVAGHFGGPPVDYESFRYAGSAAEALAQLDGGYAAWTAGVRGLDPGDARRWRARPRDRPVRRGGRAGGVGVLDGRHSQAGRRAVRRVAAVPAPGGRLLVDGGDPLREISL